MTFDPAEYRVDSRKRWGAQAAGWRSHADALRHATMPVTSWMVDAIAPQPGQEILELAAGPGDVGFLAAELIRPGGTLICSDVAPEMLTAAQERAKELAIDNVRFLQVDAEAIDLPAASVDGVLCRWGYMLLADPEAGMRETRRVVRPGGRVALAAWTRREENLWLSVTVGVLIERGLMEPPAPDEPGPFTWAEEGRIAETLHAAGFGDVEVDTVEFAMRYPNGVEQWWETTYDTSTRFREPVDALDEGARAELRSAMAERVARHIGPDGALTLPARTWVAVASA
jgi:ubiquinone/menaquinone biosynthesis C-methylase UbiE